MSPPDCWWSHVKSITNTETSKHKAGVCMDFFGVKKVHTAEDRSMETLEHLILPYRMEETINKKE